MTTETKPPSPTVDPEHIIAYLSSFITALSGAVEAAHGKGEWALLENAAVERMKDQPPSVEDEGLVKVEDLSDLDLDDGKMVLTREPSPERPLSELIVYDEVAARVVFSWVVRFDVRGTWVADGFNLDHERAQSMLAHTLSSAMGYELGAHVLAAPPADLLAQCQGYKDHADMVAKEGKG